MEIALAMAIAFFAALEIYLSHKHKKEERKQHQEIIETLERFIIDHDKERDSHK